MEKHCSDEVRASSGGNHVVLLKRSRSRAGGIEDVSRLFERDTATGDRCQSRKMIQLRRPLSIFPRVRLLRDSIR